jgi:hypothetical protein
LVAVNVESEPPQPADAEPPDPVPIAPVGRPWVGREDVGSDGLRRWERDDLQSFANTGEPAFLQEIMDIGSAVARARATRLLAAAPPVRSPPPLPSPDSSFRENATALTETLRRARAADRVK